MTLHVRAVALAGESAIPANLQLLNFRCVGVGVYRTSCYYAELYNISFL